MHSDHIGTVSKQMIKSSNDFHSTIKSRAKISWAPEKLDELKTNRVNDKLEIILL